MDKIDLCLIPFIYLLRLTLNILSVVIFLMPTPENLGKAIQNGIPWMAIISLHTTTLPISQFYLLNLMNRYPTFLVIILAMFHVRSPSTTRILAWNGAIWIALTCMKSILLGLSALHRLTQTTILKDALNYILQLSIVRLCLFWPRFYYSLFWFKPHRRSILDVITNPLPPIKAKAKGTSLKIVCLNENRCCFSFYQTRGAYAHLNQRIEKDLEEAVADASVAVFHGDPLRLAIPYTGAT